MAWLISGSVSSGGSDSAYVLAWFIAQILISLGRYGLYWMHRRNADVFSAMTWWYLLTLGTFFGGMGWAAIGLLFAADWTLWQHTGVSASIVAVASIGILSNSAVLPAMYAMSLPMALVFFLAYGTTLGDEGMILSAVWLTYLAVIVSLGRRQNASLIDSIVLQNDNDRLLKRITNTNAALVEQVQRNRAALVRAKHSEARSRSLVESAPEALLLYDLDSKSIVDSNQAAVQLLRIEPLIGASLKDVLLPAENGGNNLDVDSLIAKNGQIAAPIQEIELRGHDGNTLFCEARLALLRQPVGRLLRISLIDISVRKRAEIEVRENEQRYKALFDGNPSVCLTIDAQGQVQKINDAGRSLLGLNSRLVSMSSNIFDYLPRAEHMRLMETIRRCIENPSDMVRTEHPVLSARGRVHYVREAMRVLEGEGRLLLVWEDITETHELHSQLHWQANHDALTGLFNRQAFEAKIHALTTLGEDKMTPTHTLCFLDLDQFKVVNDTCGHQAGDELLRQLSLSIASTLRGQDILARIGGDEFAVALVGCEQEEACEIADRLRQKVEDFRFAWENNRFAVGVSIGLVSFKAGEMSADTAMAQADAACYIAKEGGRNRVEVYSPTSEDSQKRFGEMRWAVAIPEAIERERFVLRVQPIRPLQGDAPMMIEVLVRMLGEEGQLIPPGAFMAGAERFNVVHRIDRWVIEKALSWVGGLTEAHLLGRVCVNISGQSISDLRFAERIPELVLRSGVDPNVLCFEISETTAIANLSRATKVMEEMQALGCCFALDDFGVGPSSFTYIRDLAVDYLKIDEQLTRKLVSDPVSRSMVRSICELSNILGRETIAECIENRETLQIAADLGVNYGQGFEIMPPMTTSEFESYLVRPQHSAVNFGAGVISPIRKSSLHQRRSQQ